MMPDRCPLPPPRTESAPLQRYNPAMRSRVGPTGAATAGGMGFGMHNMHHNISMAPGGGGGGAANATFPARPPAAQTTGSASSESTTTTAAAGDAAARKLHTTTATSAGSSGLYHHSNSNSNSSTMLNNHAHHHQHMQQQQQPPQQQQHSNTYSSSSNNSNNVAAACGVAATASGGGNSSSGSASTTTSSPPYQPPHSSSSSSNNAVAKGEAARVREQPPYPDDRVYTVEQFLLLQHAHAPVPQAILDYAESLWKEMPENVGTLPQNSSLRDNLFKHSTVTMPSKLLTDRKLHNEVMGILGKVTEANLEIMMRELTALPIRQSTEEEIHQVVHVFFNKSTRPEDTRYTPLYVKLIAHLVGTIGSHEPAGKLIRTEVLNQCKETFMNASNDAKDLEESIAHLSEDEANLARMRFSGRQKANVFFLGQMFVHRLVVETVVLAVLDNLLYGEGRRRRVPPDYCITHFIELLQTCGPHLSASFYDKTFQRYRTVVEDLSRTYPQKRIQFILQNFVETMDNDWVPLHGPNAGAPVAGGGPRAAGGRGAGSLGGRGAGGGSSSSSSVAAHLQHLRHASSSTALSSAAAAGSSGGGSGGSASVPTRSPAPEARVKIPDGEEFWRAMDDFFATGVVDDIVTMLASIPREVAVTYCSRLMGRYITTYRYADQRRRMGELFDLLVARNAMTAATVREALIQHVYHALAEDLFVEQPKYFTHWATVISNGRAVLPSALNTRLLNILVDNRASKAVVAKMVLDVHKVMDEASSNNSNSGNNSGNNGVKAEQKDYNPHDRLRVLPALLRYTPPLLEHDTSPKDEDSILADVRDVDVEVNFFLTLCESYDEGRTSTAMQCAMDALKKAHSNAYPLIAAFFAFVRFDVDSLCTTYKEVLKKLLNGRTLASLLEEVYVQWQALDCAEVYYFAFVKRALATANTGKGDPLERLRERLRGEYEADKFVAQLDKYLK